VDCPPRLRRHWQNARVGLWAAYVVIRSDESPAETGKWNAGTGTVEGWSAYATSVNGQDEVLSGGLETSR